MAEPIRPPSDVSPATHGGLRRREVEAMGLDPSSIVDFSASINPYGPPPGVRQALRGALRGITSYPDPEASEMEVAVARRVGCDPAEVLAGAGSTQLIHLSAMAHVPSGARILVPAHTYGEYEVAARIARGRVIRIPMPGLYLDAERVAAMARDAAVTFICNPNNPTGQLLPLEDVRSLAEACSDADCIMILDEAFMDFVREPFDVLPVALDTGSVILLRSFTKTYGIPGVRAGYALGPRRLLEPMRRLRPPWSVDTLAQAAAMAALHEDEFVASSRVKLWRNRRIFQESLRVLPSSANFFLLPVGETSRVQRELLQGGFLVRQCSSFGLPDHIRFSVRRPRENRGLVEALRSVAPEAERP